MNKRIYSSGFVECSICAAKPGSPTLCPSCNENRRLLERVVANYDDLVDSKKYKASAGVSTNSIRIAVTCDDSDLMGCLEIPSEGTIDMLVNSFEEFAASLREL